MKLMESSGQQASSFLSLMEDEYSSDAAFIHAYNTQVDKGSYSLLMTSAVLPDARNYGEVIGIWGKCIDGSRLPESRGHSRHPNASSRDGAFQKRLQLEAAAMKSMMELLESMEEDLYGTFSSESTTDSSQRKRPPPDRECYNVILAAMARQINPSLYEMRLVLQRMMERVQYELENLDEEDNAADQLNELAMEFFPDIYSYNALIQARANRAAMFASDKQQQQPQQLTSPRFQHHAAWQQGQGENLRQRKRRFTSSEEEAILAEQTLDEMRNLVTLAVQPNIWSYNAVINAWAKSDSERGLQRAVAMLHSLALNGHNRIDQQDKKNGHVSTKSGANTNGEVPTVFERIARWGASLLGKGNEESDGAERHLNQSTPATKSRSNTQVGQAVRQRSSEGRGPSSSPTRNNSRNQSQQISPSVGMGSRLSYLYAATSRESSKGSTRVHRTGSHPSKQKSQPRPSPNQVSIGMAGRMAYMNSAVQDNRRKEGPASSVSPQQRNEDEKVHHGNPEPIGPMPHIDNNVTPDLRTFQLVIKALERRGTATSAKLAGDLLHLLEEYYFELNPDISLYNSVLNACAKAAKETRDVRSCLASAQKADELICTMLGKAQEESGTFPQPDQYSFLMAINAWANAASAAVSTGKVSDGQFAADHAEELLKRLQKQMLSTNKTTIACYGAVIRTWASLGRAERAQKVLEEMVEISGRLPLDLIHFNAVFDAWAQDLASVKDVDKLIPRLSGIHDLLMKMDSGGGYQSYNVDPDTSSFNHVIRACYAPWASSRAHSDESTQHEALDIAYDAFTKMNQDYNSSHRPDAHTYAHMFKAVACLLPSTTNTAPDTHSEKYGLLKTTLHACCRDGHLTKSSLWILRKMFPVEDEFAELLLTQMEQHHGDISKEKLLSIPEDRLHAFLPDEWSRKGGKNKSLNKHRQ